MPNIFDLTKGPVSIEGMEFFYGAESSGLLEENSFEEITYMYAPNPALLLHQGSEILIPRHSVTVIRPNTSVHLIVNNLENEVSSLFLRIPEKFPSELQERMEKLNMQYTLSRARINSDVRVFSFGDITIYTDASREDTESLKRGIWKKPGWFTDYSKAQTAGIAVAQWRAYPEGKETYHYHNILSESFVGICGEADFRIGDRRHVLKPGILLFFPPGVAHELCNIRTGTRNMYSHFSCQYPSLADEGKIIIKE
ncbi:cupin domain-containing protein [Candidatus Woesearchaeota archaeon]|nr:cupin domain-containing protein [Candidatus Woesearchaeota archaeon]